MSNDLKKRFTEAEDACKAARSAQEVADEAVASISALLEGRRVRVNKLGNLKGVYVITSVSAHWSGAINAHGRKVTTSGKIGSQRRDLGIIRMEAILP